MTAEVRDAYDANAELYASLFLDELDRDERTRDRLEAFADMTADHAGPVVDLGCGPGSVVNHLSRLGVHTIGYDISPGQITQARTAHPGLRFEIGDMTALDHADASLGGIVSHYAIIHLVPDSLVSVFTMWGRALQPQAPVLISFFGSRSPDAHGTPFDHRVVTAYELDPRTVGDQLAASGFTDIEIDTTPIPPGGRPLDHAILLARRRTV